MKKLIAVAVISLGLSVGAVAEDRTYSISDTLNTVGQIPTKVSATISNEIDKTKTFQKANWAELKYKWMGFNEKFLSI